MQAQLHPGTMLDGRYRIDSLLGQGGFGITYAAQNTRIGMRVAIKELFWQGHSVRRDEASPEMALLDATEEAVFEDQKRRFLQEARTIRDFSGQSGVVRILDYFEANGTAYIVMEYVEGQTLAALAAVRPMPCEDLLRRSLPLVDTLDAIHKAGVIHRDISPENIMVQPDGSLKLIDFGAARQYVGEDGRYTAISRDSYSPGEQYDRNGHQGPWTDVYSLCATLYACVCGAPPPGAVQRMFLDELKAPSEMGVAIPPACEALLMKGLQLRPEKRWQGMDELARAIRAALPDEESRPNGRKSLLIGLLAGLLCAGLALGIPGWHRYSLAHKFRGVETERILFTATDDTTAAEFAAAPDELRRRLEAFVGKDGYLLTVDGASMDLTLPLSAFDGREIPAVISEHFDGLVPEKGTRVAYELKSNWEDPARSTIAGRNQVLPEALEGPTMQYHYSWSGPLTAGQRANLIVDLKTRLDALGVPYAFGTAYGNEDVLAYRIGLARTGPFLDNTLPCMFPLKIGNAFGTVKTIDRIDDRLAVCRAEDGAPVIRFSTQDEYDIKKLAAFTRAMPKAGLDTICLLDSEDNAVARATVTTPIGDGALEFRELCVDGLDAVDGDRDWLADYLDALLCRSNLPAGLNAVARQTVDAEGSVPLDGAAPEYGIRYSPPPDHDRQIRDRLDEIEKEYGYECSENASAFRIRFGLAPDEALPDEIMARLPAFVEALDLRHTLVQKPLIVSLIDETDDMGLRFEIYSGFHYDAYTADGHFRNYWDWKWKGESMKAVYDGIYDGFIACDWDSLGLEPLFP